MDNLAHSEKNRLPLVRRQRPESLPLSYAQSRLWFLDRLEGTSTEYNLPEALRLKGELDREALEKTINTIVERHESLRTHFAEVDGEPVQIIEPMLRIELPVRDLNGLEEEEQRASVTEALRLEWKQPFDLTRGPLLRMKLLKLGAQEHVLLRTMHHIVSDGWSQGVFNREFMVLYEAYCEGRENPLKPLTVQYADFALWQREWLAEGALGGGLTYWKEQLAGAPEWLELPTDRMPQAVQTFEAEQYHFTLPAQQVAQLKQLSRENQATLYMTLLAAFGVLLSRYSGQDDIVVGSPIANRQEAQLEELIGSFVNMLAMRMRVKPEMSFRELLGQVRHTALEAYQYQDVPFERLVEELSPQRSLNRTPVVQVLFALQNAPWVRQELKGLEAESIRGSDLRVHFDLEVHAFEREGRFWVSWRYNEDLFNQERIEQMARHYERVLQAVVANADEAIGRVDLLGMEERLQILEEWNGPIQSIPEGTLPELFEKQVARSPLAPALTFEGVTLSYQELNEQANKLAHLLIREGVGPEDVVALAVPRSVEMVVSLLGILKSGAAYLPLDPEYPADRLMFMLEDAEPVCVITTSEIASHLPFGKAPILLDDAEVAAALMQSPANNPGGMERRNPINPQNPAYVIYTSGSTGTPKGIIISHDALYTFVDALTQHLRIHSGDCHLALTTIAFDISILELLLPLACGAKVLIAGEQDIGDPVKLSRLIETYEVNVVQTTPSHWGLMIGEHPPLQKLRLLVGGESLSRELAMALYSTGSEVYNLYGPTEATIWASVYSLTEDDLSETAPNVIAIGSPLRNTRVYVLDGSLQLVPVGVTGELYIAGAGLARGYLKRPAMTAERFVADPHGKPGTRMYRTGDLARWRADGNLEFVGRSDHQVKLRGFRIELGEIEATLRSLDYVQDAVVIARGEGEEKRLLGYVIASPSVDPGTLRRHLTETLPGYMIPAAMMVLPSWPLTPNGKVDRNALPEPGFTPTVWRAPRTPEEEILCSLFAEVLGLQRVGIDDDFFALGGHSLLATRLVSRIRTTLDVELAIRMLFELPSIAELAPRLRHSEKNRLPLVRRQRPESLPLSYAQSRLWFLDRLEGTSTEYNLPEALRLKGELDREALEKTINTIVERHESLRTHFAEVDGEPVQIIEPMLRIELPVRDLNGLEEEEQRASVTEALRLEWKQPFDLTRGPLLRMKLLKLGAQEHVLLRTMHHIVSDGWSQGVFNREFMVLYEAYCEGRENPLKPLTVQYADFALWQREWLAEGALGGGLTYWKEQLAGAPEWLELPTDRMRPAVQTFEAEQYHFTLPAQQVAQLKQLSRENQATLYMTLLAAFGVLLSRYSGQDDIVVGSPIANRQEAQLEELIGFFVNMLAMRMRVKPEMSFRELLGQVRHTALEAYQYQDVPFERLVEELSPQRSLNRTPVVQVLFALQNAPWVRQELKGLEAESIRGSDLRVRFDLEVHGWEREGKIVFTWGYKRDLFNQERIEQMARHYERVLQAVVANADEAIGRVDLLGMEERLQILEEWNGPIQSIPEGTLPELFEKQVARSPLAPALTFEGVTLSYQELNEQANKLAHLLIREGVGPEDVVALAVPRSVEMVVSLLGILKSGAAYLPLDPEYPADRLMFMLEDAEPVCVITTSEIASHLPFGKAPILLDDAEVAAALMQSPANNPGGMERRNPINPQNPAYVIYTSGSTGTPKGVVVTHQNVTRLFGITEQWFHFGPADIWTLFHSYAFDFSVWEMWGPLLYGGRLVVVPYLTSRSPAEFLKLLVEERVTVLNQTPSGFHQLMQADREDLDTGGILALRYVIFGGEALDLRRLEDWYQRHSASPSLINMYGITETTVHVTHIALNPEITQGESHSIVGRGLPDLRVYVLDGSLQLVPVGVTGELYIAGAGLARGYLKRPAMTAERFVADPHGKPGTRMYRTGDLARWRADGNLEFVGRSDHQVKLRGFRIELGEIEATLRSLDYVQDAVVIARGEGEEKRLLGYVIASPSVDPGTLRRHLTETLPGYMIPAAMMVLPSWPLTPNGKVDRNALPEPGFTPTVWRAPRTPEEEILCSLFAEVLGLQRVGIDDNFFALGGDSILSIQLVSRARQAGLLITPRHIFQHQTIDALAAVTNAVPEIVAVQSEEARCAPATPIMCWLQDRGGPLNHFSQSMLLHVPAEIEMIQFKAALQEVIDHHDALRLRLVRSSESGSWSFETGAPGEKVVEKCLLRVDISAMDKKAQRACIANQEEAARGRLNPEAGILVQAVWFDAGPNEARRLLLVIHHLAVDIVSWRFIIPDLTMACQAIAVRQQPKLPEKSTSFWHWAEQLSTHSQDRNGELSFWTEMLSKPTLRLVRGSQLNPKRDTIGNAKRLSLTLPANVTVPLLTNVPAAVRGQINDVLLTALVVALAHWRSDSGNNAALVDVETHGRQHIFEGIDLSRTVGWFTTIFPLRLDINTVNLTDAWNGGCALGQALKIIKEQLRAVPDGGVGYGILRYLNQGTKSALAKFAKPEIGFNYLGRFGRGDTTAGRIVPDVNAFGGGADPEMPLAHCLEVNAITQDSSERSELTATWSWAPSLLSEQDVRALAEGWFHALQEFAHLMAEPDTGGLTPSDVPLVSLTQAEIERLENEYRHR